MLSKPDHKGATNSGEASGAAWMLTFADLLSLLLTFFVLLYSMSTIQYENWRAVVETMTYQFNPNRPKIVIEPTVDEGKLQESNGFGLNLTYLEARFERAMSEEASFEGAIVSRAPDGVVISIPADILFNRKGTLLQPGVLKAFRAIAGIMVQIDNQIKIAGHTDSVPVSSGLFRSNWELSLTRARIVAGIMADSGYLEPITVLGYADTGSMRSGQPQLTSANMEERIDIIIVAERKDKSPYAVF